MRCAHCGHDAEQHDDEGTCHVRILTGWSNNENRFTGERPCGCEEYAGRYVPPDPNGCPHELIPASKLCVHCGRATVESDH